MTCPGAAFQCRRSMDPAGGERGAGAEEKKNNISPSTRFAPSPWRSGRLHLQPQVQLASQ